MKTRMIKIISVLLLFSYIFTGCYEHRRIERDRDDRRYHQRDRHDDDHHDNDRHDDNHDNH